MEILKSYISNTIGLCEKPWIVYKNHEAIHRNLLFRKSLIFGCHNYFLFNSFYCIFFKVVFKVFPGQHNMEFLLIFYFHMMHIYLKTSFHSLIVK
jgi:hypothetical protein